MYDKRTVVLNRESCEVLSANTSAYAFIGDHYYHAFDRLVYEPDLAEFRRQLAACDGGSFPLRLLDSDESPVPFLASVTASTNPHAAVVSFFPMKTLSAMLEAQQRRLLLKDAVLGIYGDEYFEYSHSTGLIRIYSIDTYEKTIAEVPLDTFFNRMRRLAPPDARPAVEQFCTDFVSQRTLFTLRADGHLLDDRKSAVVTLIKGISLFERNCYIGAAGILHFGRQRNSSASIRGERDSLTGLLSKADITSAAIGMIDANRMENTAIVIVDVDYFKNVNDTFGHMTGDIVLKHIASLLADEVGPNGLVGRIGGDEFMIICFHVADMEDNRALLRSIKNRVAAIYPPDDPRKPRVTLSIGCASYPKDADSYESVFRLADYAMYRAKHNGRNRYVIFDKDKHGSAADILARPIMPSRMNDHGDMSPSDIVCTLMSRAFSARPDPVDVMLEEAALNLGLQRVMLYAGDPWRVICMAGEKRPDAPTLLATIPYLDAPELQRMYDENGILVLDDVERIRAMRLDFYPLMKKQGILSCVHIRGTDAAGQRFLLSFESVSRRVTWNPDLIRYYTLFQHILHQYRLA